MRRPGRMSPPARLYAPASLRARITGRQGRAQSLRCRATTSLAEKKPKKSSTGPKRPAGPPADPRPLLFVVLLGLSGEPLRVRCETIARLVRLRATEPLFLVDDDTSLAYFRRRCLLFEFVPPRATRALVSPSLQWDLYARRRAKLLHEKWQPAAVMALCRIAGEFAALMPEGVRSPTPRAAKRRRNVLRRIRRMFQ